MRDQASILHVDLDAFFASVEQLDEPSLRGKPVVVGGLGNRGVVSAASYEARAFGVHSAMPMVRARRACPQATFLAPRFARYSELSRAVMAILGSVSPLVEPLSIDEAFVDVTGALRLLGTPTEIAETLRHRIRDDVGLTASIGAASTKFLAKLASDLAKPDGLLVVTPGTEQDFLAPLPVSRLWGVGPATLRRLDRLAIRTIGELAALPEEVLTHALGASLGRHLYALARNDDDRAIVTDREAKSIGAEETFEVDLRSRPACERELVRLADKVCSRARHGSVLARTITLKIRFANFETRTRSRTLPAATAVSTVVLETARELLAQLDVARGVRLLGISLSKLEPGEVIELQQGLLDLGVESDIDADRNVDADGARTERRAALERAVDDVRGRFGSEAVTAATLVEKQAGGGRGTS